MLLTLKYICSLIDAQVVKGVPPDRIVLGGFSQGCAISLLVHLASKFSRKLVGICGFSSFLPLPDRLQDLRKDADLRPEIGDVPILFSRGTKDMLVPKRYHRICLQKLKDLGIRDELGEAHEYDGLGHTISGAILRDICD